ncbi:MAG: GDSL-type esterase/lipase family protein [Actinomycetota bacterium]|nr:GDSL-type esterase/lipase family protein [Actinomycetota bacterium]
MTTLGRRSFLALGAAALVGCTNTAARQSQPLAPRPGPTLQPNSAITSLAMVGDSITAGSAPALTTGLTAAGVESLRIEGEASRRIDVGSGRGSEPLSGVKVVFSLLAEGLQPGAWVIELGTNDVGSYADADAYGDLIDKITTMLPPPTPLAWVNVYRPQYPEHTVMFNDVLAQRMAARGNAVVADWYSVASGPDQSVLRADNLHPNDNGEQALTLLVIQALQQL